MSEQTSLEPDEVPLVAALVEVERHVDQTGWNQPARLFALVATSDLMRNEPSLATQLSASPADGLSSVEQSDFEPGDDWRQSVTYLRWPSSVAGCALAWERPMLAAQYEADLPDDPQAAARYVKDHPHRQCVRIVVGVLRDGSRYGIGRSMSHPEVLVDGGENFALDVAAELGRTLR